MHYQDIFGLRLKELREEREMTQGDFSDFIGIRQQTLSAYEKGLRNPSLEIIYIISEKCGVSIDWLCGLSEQKHGELEFSTYTDIIKTLLALCDIDISPSSFRLEMEENDKHKCGIVINNEDLYILLNDVKQMKDVLNSGALSTDIYNTWLKGFLEKCNKVFPTWRDIVDK